MKAFSTETNFNGRGFDFDGEDIFDAIRNNMDRLMTHGSKWILGNYKIVKATLAPRFSRTEDGERWAGILLHITFRSYDLDPAKLDVERDVILPIRCHDVEDVPRGEMEPPLEWIVEK